MPEIDYSIQAVPTFCKGYTFRSRLEARWAALFDLCGWPWEYEPADFNGWFPDFLLRGMKANRVFAEVKPIAERCLELEERIDRSGCPDECLIVGICPTLSGSWMDCRLGWLRDRQEAEVYGKPHVTFSWGEALLFTPCLDGEMVDFLHADGSYAGRMSGIYTGGTPLDVDRAMIARLWGRAHEMTRYDPS